MCVSACMCVCVCFDVCTGICMSCLKAFHEFLCIWCVLSQGLLATHFHFFRSTQIESTHIVLSDMRVGFRCLVLSLSLFAHLVILVCGIFGPCFQIMCSLPWCCHVVGILHVVVSRNPSHGNIGRRFVVRINVGFRDGEWVPVCSGHIARPMFNVDGSGL